MRISRVMPLKLNNASKRKLEKTLSLFCRYLAIPCYYCHNDLCSHFYFIMNAETQSLEPRSFLQGKEIKNLLTLCLPFSVLKNNAY